MRHAPLLALFVLAACGPALPGGSAGPDAPTCGDDAHAPNGSQEEAAATVETGEWSWVDPDVVLCPGAEDWFAWSAQDGDCWPGFDARWDDGLGDLDLTVLDAGGSVIAGPATDWDGGRTGASGEPGEGFVRVRRLDEGAEPLSYELHINVDCLAL